jgi:signal transduction histidine kinase
MYEPKMITALEGIDPAAMSADVVHERLSALLETAQVVNSSLELTEVLDHILRRAKELLRAESGSVMLVSDETGQLTVQAAQGPRAETIVGRVQRVGHGVSGWVATHGKPVRLHGPATDPSFRNVCDRIDVRDAVCAPLLAETGLLGVICLSNRLDAESFSEADLDLLVALSNQAALAIRNARAFHEMRRQRQQVARLLEELTHAQERERARIALLIHDGPAQTLYAALRNLEAFRVLSNNQSETAPRVLDEVELTIRKAIQETRSAMVDLRPICLDEIGLHAALLQYAQQFEQRTGISCRVAKRGALQRLPTMVESCFYRIAQEALTNVWKHAEAKNATVSLSVDARKCVLEINDDGKGIDPDALDAVEGEHLGMVSLRDRAELVGGTLQVTAASGGGTTVRVTAPMFA